MISLICGDSLHIPLADETVQCVVTSPPYWNLRDYGIDGQLGNEPTPEEYTANLVTVFREVWRVLRPDGVLFLNLGDSYAGSGGVGNQRDDANKGNMPHFKSQSSAIVTRKSLRPDKADVCTEGTHSVLGLKPKDLIGVPWRVAFALQADGWYLRSDIIWHKPNPMPESVRDRPTKSHEYLFLLSKSQRYYYDQEAVREPYINPDINATDSAICGFRETPPEEGQHSALGKPRKTFYQNIGRNRRTVWTIPTSPYSGAHFATFPPALVEPCILAGTSERGCCPTCGKPWERVVEKGYRAPAQEDVIAEMIAKGVPRQKANLYGNPSRDPKLYAANPDRFLGWRAACDCPPADPVPCTVLDPFAGTFTVGMVAAKHRRNAVGIELKPEYIELARKRCSDIQIQFI